MSDKAIETFSAFADDYEASRRLMIEPYDEFYGTVVGALRLAERPIKRVLDLGAGTGIVSRFVAEAYPNVELTLLDGSTAMLERARGHLGTGASYVVSDLRAELPTGAFDAVVSGMAIHHLPHEDQKDLYARVARQIPHGGIFVNGEIFGGAGPRTIDSYQRWHEQSVKQRGGTDEDWAAYLKRQEADRCAPISEHLRWLTGAGFTEVDCLYKQRLFTVLVGLA